MSEGELFDVIEASPAIDKLIPALLASREEFSAAKKDSENPHFRSRYASLKAIYDACQEPLARHGVVIMNPIIHKGNGHEISCLLLHTSGQWIRSRAMLPATNKPQELGSAITYYSRYLIAALLAIATEDDDGEFASGRGVPSHEPRVARNEPRQRGGRPIVETRPEFPPDPSMHPAAPSDHGGSQFQSEKLWGAWIKDQCVKLNDLWRNELAIADAPQSFRDDYNELANTHQVTNHVCTKAIEAGLINLADTTKEDGKTRDKAKAMIQVSRLYYTSRKRVEAVVKIYFEEKLTEAKASMQTAMEGKSGEE